ncbi:hypothetical protein BRC82_02835 [Halobacteriales archaeon QS_1_67_19]|nr:MAG: hypothetical protein BRC82_02835 [Halobacteriales archaeon QS_1_67_19]
MSTSDIRGKLRRFDRWLGARVDWLFEAKLRLDAIYCRKRAERAEAAGDAQAAENYYDRARSLRGKLGDRERNVDLAMKHAALARRNGNRGIARKQYERVVELCARRNEGAAALEAIEPLIGMADERGDDEELATWWKHALTALGKAEPGEISERRRRELVDRYAEQVHTEGSVGQLYGFALDRLADATAPEGDRAWASDEAAAGTDLLDATWERRDAVRESVAQFRVLLAAGLARVAYADLTDRAVDREEALSLAAEHREKLSEPATALYERLADGETDADREALRVDLDREVPPELREVESEVFARFIADL